MLLLDRRRDVGMMEEVIVFVIIITTVTVTVTVIKDGEKNSPDQWQCK